MPVSIIDLTSQLSTLKGGSAYYYGKLGVGRNVGVKKLGPLVFPLNKLQLKALIDVAHTAPFGKGHQTLVDRSVRNTWEIDADQLDLSDSKLKGALKAFLDEAGSEMGIQGKIIAKPYKLLIYEKGGFFVEHQDSEKLSDMFGTLLVGLPCAHAGGELTINPGNGERVAIDFSENDAKDFPAVAFFADRKHEVGQVTEGHRVVLVYNLVYADGEVPAKVNPQAAAAALSPILGQLQETDAPICLALDHQYTDTNFSTDRLKGNDVVRVAALRKAAAMAGVNLRVGLIEQHTSANWENADQFGQGYDYGYRSRRSRYRYDDYAVETTPKSFAEVEPGEVFEGHLIMSDWLSDDGEGIGELHLEEEQIIVPLDRAEEDPIEWSVEGYQGNWGMTTDFTYRYAGVLLWHPDATGQIVGKMPLGTRLGWLQKELKRKPAAVNKLIVVLTSVATSLQSERYHSVDLGQATKALLRIGKLFAGANQKIIAPWYPVLVRDFEKVPATDWPAIASVFGVEFVEEVLTKIMENTEQPIYYAKERQVPVVVATVRELLTSKQPEAIALGESLLEKLEDYLTAFSTRALSSETYVRELLLLAEKQPSYTLWDDVERINKLLPELHEPVWIRTILAPTILKSKVSAYFLLDTLLTNLKARIATVPEPYADLRRPLPSGMEKPSGAFKEMMDFLVDPKQKTFDFKRPQGERDELARFIDREQLDLSGITLKTRPSHTLRLTKTNASFQRVKKAYIQDLKLYEQLAELAGRSERPVSQAGRDALGVAVDFLTQLCVEATRNGHRETDITTALNCYRGHFLAEVSGQPPETYTVTPQVENMLDVWEERLENRYQNHTDDWAIPKVYPTLAALWVAAFEQVLKA